MQKSSKLGFAGHVQARIIRNITPAPMGWRLRNSLRIGFIKGWLAAKLIVPLANAFGVMTVMGELSIRVRRNGHWIDYGVVCRRVVTNAGVAFLVDNWDGGVTDIATLIYHGCGTDNTAENAADTALGAESTTALDPDSTRATGTQSQPASNQLRSVGTLDFDNTAAIVEHGLFSQPATGGGTLWDRSVFAALNVVSGDSIAFTYTLTASAGS